MSYKRPLIRLIWLSMSYLEHTNVYCVPFLHTKINRFLLALFHLVRPFGSFRRSTDASISSAAPVAIASGRESMARVHRGDVGAAIAPAARTNPMAAVIPPTMTNLLLDLSIC